MTGNEEESVASQRVSMIEVLSCETFVDVWDCHIGMVFCHCTDVGTLKYGQQMASMQFPCHMLLASNHPRFLPCWSEYCCQSWEHLCCIPHCGTPGSRFQTDSHSFPMYDSSLCCRLDAARSYPLQPPLLSSLLNHRSLVLSDGQNHLSCWLWWWWCCCSCQ